MLIKQFLGQRAGLIPDYISYLLAEKNEELLQFSASSLRENITPDLLKNISQILNSSFINEVKVDEDFYHLRLNTYNGALDLVIKAKDDIIDWLSFFPSPGPECLIKNGAFFEKKLEELGNSPVPGGKICHPDGIKPVALLFLLPGSGPQNMDYCIGANSIFRKLAHELSSHGIITVRFDKRFYKKVEGLSYRPINLKNEIVEDTMNIVSLVAKNAEYQDIPVFLAGHSLGAYLAPMLSYKIIKETGLKISGIISLSTPYRKIGQLIQDQIAALTSTQPVSTHEQVSLFLDSLDKEYIKELDENHPLYFIEKIKDVPIFFIQGGKDIQVTAEKDFSQWKVNMAERENIKFKIYENINHILVQPTHNATLAEQYLCEGIFPKNLSNDIAIWIQEKLSETII